LPTELSAGQFVPLRGADESTQPRCNPEKTQAAVTKKGGRLHFLASVGREKELSSLDPEDAYLSNTAARLARQIKHAADGIERELDGAPGAGHAGA
jgi:hypothetical protein